MDLPSIGLQISLYRDRRGLTQEALAAQMQARGFRRMARQRIVEIENGHRRVYTRELVAFSRILRVPISQLLGVPDDDPSEY
jgi:transcriptional regulator with XRE-family HTH domain